MDKESGCSLFTALRRTTKAVRRLKGPASGSDTRMIGFSAFWETKTLDTPYLSPQGYWGGRDEGRGRDKEQRGQLWRCGATAAIVATVSDIAVQTRPQVKVLTTRAKEALPIIAVEVPLSR